MRECHNLSGPTGLLSSIRLLGFCYKKVLGVIQSNVSSILAFPSISSVHMSSKKNCSIIVTVIARLQFIMNSLKITFFQGNRFLHEAIIGADKIF